MQAPLAIITGATGGIGSCLARRLASEGWALHLIDLDEPRLENLCAELPGATFSASDLATPESCQNALPKGRDITAVIHLAGIFVSHDMGAGSRGTYDEVMQHNATNAFDLIGAALPTMADGGRIVLTSSLSFNRGPAEYAAYTMAKGAIVGLTRSVSRQVGARGICVNALAPGIVETRMTDELVERRGRKEIEASIPLGRLGQPEDVVGPICFLLSKDAAYITGQVINVDGGIVNG